MPLAIRKLDQQEASEAFKSNNTKAVDLTEYVESLKGLNVNDSAAIVESGETGRTLKRRFNAAAKLLGVQLKWEIQEHGTYFKVVEPSTRGKRNGTSNGTASDSD